MVQRIRTRASTPDGGWASTKGGIPCTITHFWRYVTKEVDIVTDNVLPGDNHAFERTRFRVQGVGATVLGTGCSGTVERAHNLYPGYVVSRTTSTSNHLVNVLVPSDGALASELLAKTNPSRPVVDLPIAIFELRELPLLMKGYGDKLLKNAANANLSYQFGIAPLISDLSSLLNFQSEFEKRAAELEAMRKGGLRRKRSLGTWSVPRLDSITLNSSQSPYGGLALASRLTVTREDAYGFVRWKFDPQNYPRTSRDLARRARNAVLGLTADFSTAWNAMPWTWLIDWCTSAGDYLAAKRNIVGASPHDVCIMRHKYTEEKLTRNGGVWPNQWGPPTIVKDFGPYTITWDTISRAPASPTVDAQLSFLSGRQLSILASIGIKKYRS